MGFSNTAWDFWGGVQVVRNAAIWVERRFKGFRSMLLVLCARIHSTVWDLSALGLVAHTRYHEVCSQGL